MKTAKPKHRWAKGESGNKRGRPKGAEGKVTKTAREIFTAFVEGNAARVQELWEKVARQSPAKALVIYAKLAEFVLPKLMRTELSGQLDHRVAQITVNRNDPVEVMGSYKEMIDGAEINYVDGPTPEQVYRSLFPTAQQPVPERAQQPVPRPAIERPSRPESAPEDAESAEPGPETNVAVILPRHSGDHEPIVDSKCPWCRKLWQEMQQLAEDEKLRAMRPPQVVT